MREYDHRSPEDISQDIRVQQTAALVGQVSKLTKEIAEWELISDELTAKCQMLERQVGDAYEAGKEEVMIEQSEMIAELVSRLDLANLRIRQTEGLLGSCLSMANDGLKLAPRIIETLADRPELPQEKYNEQ